MSTRFSAVYVGSKFPYVIVRRVADGKVWNGSALATWADGSIGSYDIPLISQGGDLWQTDIPASLPSGYEYHFLYYLAESAATPATSDLALPSERVWWSGGQAGTSGVSTTLPSYTLAELKKVVHHAADQAPNQQLTNATDVINDAVNRLHSLHEWEWRWKTTTLSTTEDQDYVLLPTDFHSLHDIRTASGEGLTFLNQGDLGRYRAGSSNIVTGGRSLYSISLRPQTSDDGYPRARLELFPTPTESTVDAFTINYRFQHRALSVDTDRVSIPAHLLTLLKQIIRAEAAHVSRSEWADREEERLQRMLPSFIVNDGLLTPGIGMMKGAIGHGRGVDWIPTITIPE